VSRLPRNISEIANYDSLDGKNVFRDGLLQLRAKLEERQYTSISAFSKEFAAVFSTEIGAGDVGNTAELQLQIAVRAAPQELTLEQRDKRKLAKRIIKAVQPALEDAIRKESELNGKPFEKGLKQLDLLLENSVLSRRDSYAGTSEHDSARSMLLPNGVDHVPMEGIEENGATEVKDGVLGDKTNMQSPAKSGKQIDDNAMDIDSVDANRQLHAEANFAPTSPREPSNVHHSSETPPAMTNGVKSSKGAADGKTPKHVEPPTPPMSFEGDALLPPFQGGIPWYMEPFDPDGTTIHEERWTGREVVRGMSEELSDMDEDEVDELVNVSQLPDAKASAAVPAVNGGIAEVQEMRVVKKRNHRWKGYKK
jgi:NuA3 HAT complex component NTO1